MARPFAEAFYNSAAWKKCRAAYINQRIAVDGGLCEVCHRELGYIVHHKIWLTEENINDPEIALNTGNLRFECLQCHNMEEPDGGRKTDGRENQYAFDEEGQMVPLPP